MDKTGKDRDIIDLTHFDWLLKEASLKPVFQLTPLFGTPGYNHRTIYHIKLWNG